MPINNVFPFEEDDEQEIEDIAIVIMLCAIAILGNRLRPKIPKHTYVLTGSAHVQEVLNGHPDKIYEIFRMARSPFLLLCVNLMEHGGLKHSRHLSVHEQVMIFLLVVGHNTRNRVCQDRFQHSGETISKYFNKVLKACCRFGQILIRPPNLEEIPEKILNSSRFFPHFKDCVGAIDGTHIKTIVPPGQQIAHRNYRTVTTQNVMAICDFDLRFTYVLAGWEGTANDSRILTDCIADPAMQFPMPPRGKYYLADSGYQNMKEILVPYKGVRYHVPEYQATRPQGLEEWYNHRHSSLRCPIECCFGILKKRFPILREMPWGLKFSTQKYIVLACCCLHNFLIQYRHNDPILVQFMQDSELGDPDWTPPDEPEIEPQTFPRLDLTPPTLAKWNRKHDKIARSIYSDVLRGGGS